jgi:uncharacterized protein (DUF1015 family)
MARVEPFRAWRPKAELAEKVASPPYDVLNTEEAREMAAGNPLSFLHVNKPEIDLPEGTDPYDDAVYGTGGTNLRKLIDDGVLLRDSSECYYLYQQQMGDHVQIGVVAGASVDEYEADIIKKHEHTRRKKEDDRTRHVDALNANTGPVFLTYKADSMIDTLVGEMVQGDPEYDFTAPDGVRHTLWVVSNRVEVATLQEAFANIPVLYVADGHHRSAAAVRVREARRAANPNHTGEEPYNFFLSVIFPDNQMMIMDYNRVVRDLNGMSPEAFLDAIRERFDVEPCEEPRPAERTTFGLYLGGSWYRLTAHPEIIPEDDPVGSLDVAILQEQLLAPVLGIGDPRADERVDFVGGIRGPEELVRLVDSGDWAVAFTVYPTSISQLFAVADAGEVMPPKSTWFEPKLRSGLIIRPLDD